MAVQPLEKARSLPFSAYTDPVVIEEESTSIFSREWVFVCVAGEVSQPGDYFAMIVALKDALKRSMPKRIELSFF